MKESHPHDINITKESPNYQKPQQKTPSKYLWTGYKKPESCSLKAVYIFGQLRFMLSSTVFMNNTFAAYTVNGRNSLGKKG